MRATTGAAPVPVPPPMPAVMNTMSAPSSMSAMACSSSSAAARPTAGRRPSRGPCVSVGTELELRRRERLRQRLDVGVRGMNSTPLSPAAIMRLTALPPAPPTPMTLIVAAGCAIDFEFEHVHPPWPLRALVLPAARSRTAPRRSAADPIGHRQARASGACRTSPLRSAPRAGSGPPRSRSAGRATFSISPESPLGTPRRTGISKICSASSTLPAGATCRRSGRRPRRAGRQSGSSASPCSRA